MRVFRCGCLFAVCDYGCVRVLCFLACVLLCVFVLLFLCAVLLTGCVVLSLVFVMPFSPWVVGVSAAVLLLLACVFLFLFVCVVLSCCLSGWCFVYVCVPALLLLNFLCCL